MPLYEFKCENGHEIEKRLKMSDTKENLECPDCKKLLKLKMSVPASVFPGADSWRK